MKNVRQTVPVGHASYGGIFEAYVCFSVPESVICFDHWSSYQHLTQLGIFTKLWSFVDFKIQIPEFMPVTSKVLGLKSRCDEG